MKYIFSDFDGTLTNRGLLGPIFFDIVELIQKNKKEFIIVSGRSLSWGHFLLTHFPLQEVIMEGGGVIISKNADGEITEENLVDDEKIELLARHTQQLQKDVPSVVLSADSFGRRTDRAIEFLQMDDGDVEKVENYLREHKINFSRSNVHINFWVGDVSKAAAVKKFLEKKNINNFDDCLFYGDAMNDESMFELFSHTVGVSNISEIIDKLEYKPSLVLEGSENAGAKGVYNHLKDFLN